MILKNAETSGILANYAFKFWIIPYVAWVVIAPHIRGIGYAGWYRLKQVLFWIADGLGRL